MSPRVRVLLMVVAVLAAIAAIAHVIGDRSPRLTQHQVMQMYAAGVRVGDATFADPLEEATEAPPPTDCGDRMWRTFIGTQKLISAATEDGAMANTVVLPGRQQAAGRLRAVRDQIEGCVGPGTTYRLERQASRDGTRWALHEVSFNGVPNGWSMLWQYGNVLVSLTVDPRVSPEQIDASFRAAVDAAAG